MKKRAFLVATALGLALALVPTSAGARQAFATDVDLVSAENVGGTEYMFAGVLTSAKTKCLRNRVVTVAGYLPEMRKRRAIGPTLDTTVTSRHGAWALRIDASDVPPGWGYKVVAKGRQLKDGDSCKKGSVAFEI
jgi:hypothetical protein